MGELVLDSTCFLIGEKTKYLTALLNSKVLNWELFKISPKTGTGDLIISVQALEPLMIHYPAKNEEKPFEMMVDFILFAKESGHEKEANFFEQVIDNMVYDLYFEESMKNNSCYITESVKNILTPDFEQPNKEKMEKLYFKLKEDKVVQRGLIYSRVVKEVEIINRGKHD
ncbi:MAG: hypothetical protein RBT46_08715 [Weeksellaceae bacterium]|nr:hypothetical protein [Weeksellaceae bacterium]